MVSWQILIYLVKDLLLWAKKKKKRKQELPYVFKRVCLYDLFYHYVDVHYDH